MKMKLMLVTFALLFLNGTVVFAQLDPLTDYDDFNDKWFNDCKRCINPEKWRGSQSGDYVTELVREIKAKRAHISHRSWGTDDSDDGRETGRNRMVFRDSLNMSGVCFVPRVKKYEVLDCAANMDTSRVRIRYFGNFYDTDTSDLGGQDGIIYAGINVERSANSADKKGVLEVSGWVSECDGIDCENEAWTTYDGIDDPDLFFGTIKAKGNKKSMCVGYDRTNHEFVFSFDDDVRTVNFADHGLPARVGDVNTDTTFHVIETRADTENCTAEAISGFIDADFDNVMIREFP